MSFSVRLQIDLIVHLSPSINEFNSFWHLYGATIKYLLFLVLTSLFPLLEFADCGSMVKFPIEFKYISLNCLARPTLTGNEGLITLDCSSLFLCATICSMVRVNLLSFFSFKSSCDMGVATGCSLSLR